MIASPMLRPRQTLAGILLALALAAALAQPAVAGTSAPVVQTQPGAVTDGADAGPKTEPASFIGQGWG